MWIVGLGNPGPRYAGTRHNVGFELVDVLVERFDASPVRADATMLVWRGASGWEECLLVKPMTYMNRSGLAVRALVDRYELDIADGLCVVDDMALDLGRIRFRERGSSGNHNGLESIEEHLGTRDYPRLRIGIGPAPDAESWVDFVLERFSDDERGTLDAALERAADGVESLMSASFEDTMSRFNG